MNNWEIYNKNIVYSSVMTQVCSMWLGTRHLAQPLTLLSFTDQDDSSLGTLEKLTQSHLWGPERWLSCYEHLCL